MTNTERIQANNTELRECIEIAKNLPAANGGGTELEDALVGGIARETITKYSNERVTVLRDYIFNDFSNLQEVNLPNVETVGSYALYKCKKLTEIDLPKCTTIDSYSLTDCKALVKVNMPLVTKVGSYAFSQNAMLFDVNIPLVKNLGRQAFYYCTALEKLDFHLLDTIDTYGFTNCRNLETVIIRTPTICSMANSNVFNGAKISNGTGYIYVPADLVESYKTATNWVTYANQIRAIEDYPEITGG